MPRDKRLMGDVRFQKTFAADGYQISETYYDITLSALGGAAVDIRVQWPVIVGFRPIPSLAVILITSVEFELTIVSGWHCCMVRDVLRCSPWLGTQKGRKSSRHPSFGRYGCSRGASWPA